MTREPFWRRYDRFFGRDRHADTGEEVRFHYEMRVRDYMSRGMDEASARRAADTRLGGVTNTLEDCKVQDDRYTTRDHRREWFGELKQDLAYGLRTLLRAPTFAAVAILTLALGIGATTAMFSVVNRVLLASLPFPDAGRLVRIYERAPEGRNDRNPVSAGNYIDWSTRAKSLAAVGAFSSAGSTALIGDGEPDQIMTRSVTPSWFATYGARPLIGRVFLAEDANAGGVTVLSEGLWRRRFGGDSAVLGRAITLGSSSTTIVGVMPAAAGDGVVDAWTVVRNQNLDPTQRKSHNYSVVGRLAPNVTLGQARDEMTALANAIAADHPEFMKDWGVNIVPLHDDIVGGYRTMLVVVMGAVVVVLLIACGNLANLLLARAAAREREMVVRGALGAGRGRLVRQLLTESLLIAIIGGAIGVGAAAASIELILGVAPPIPFAERIGVDLPVVGFAIGLTVFCTLLFGLAPALHLSRFDLQRTLRSATSGAPGHARFRGVLLATQIALSVVLLVCAGLLVRSFRALSATDLGMRIDDLSVLTVDLPRSRYQELSHHIQFHGDLLERLSAVPGVRGVAATTVEPTTGSATWGYAIENRPSPNASGREAPQPVHFISGDYTAVLGVPLKRGRTFTQFDRAGAPVVVMINEALARLHWLNDDPVGRRISLVGQEGPWMEIVGVVGDTRMESADLAPQPAIYIPYAQKPYTWLSWMTYVIRTDAGVDPATLVPSIRAAVWQGDRLIPVRQITPVADLYANTVATRKFAMMLVSAFGLVALLLCVVGLYGLISYNVSQQRREIGVRLALGATESGIVGGVLARSARLALIGAAIGLFGAFGATRLIGDMLYGVSPLDAVAFASSAIVAVLVAIAAAWIPAARAARASPLAALRS